ncbi:hypothetical protein SAMN02910369_02316 [Lachnospiraceae bacterium NE2001]|nr:hypothetical protein SAMN02910369_02316 [Lachnospiraceae bacterium NE2001]
MNKPVRSDEALYKTVDQLMRETNLCRGNVMKIASESDSILRIGRAVRINVKKFYDYLEMEYGS